MPARSVFGKRIAVLVIDVTRGNVEDRWTNDPHVRTLLDPIARLLAAARSKGMPVFYTHGGLFSQTAKAARITPVERGSWAYRVPLNNDRGTTCEELEESMQIPPQIAPLADEVVIRKIQPSGFFETPLHGFLNLHQIDTVIICGTATHSGVLYTVADAFAYNYRVIVPRECSATRQAEFQEFSFNLMGLTHAEIVFLDEVLQEIENRPTQESVLRPGRPGGTYSQRAGFGKHPAVLVIDVHRGSADDRSTAQGALQAIGQAH